MCSDLRALYMARYARGGRGELDPSTGTALYDCWGLAMAAHRLFGLALPDFSHDPDDVRAVAREFRAQAGTGLWERLENPEVPCLVALRHDDRAVRAVNHFATYIGEGRFLHILNEADVHVSALTDVTYATRVAGFWRWNGEA